ncbi:MAG TPA: cystathionine beta-lyase, partial [Mammaliicoccus lentus]|nr:cystathionine beta-lyase [Mammaliicoccus lentus]
MFEKNIERKNTNSAKWEEAIIETKTNNPIVLTVADMDFATAPNIIKTIVQTAQYGIFGYTNLSSSYKSI